MNEVKKNLDTFVFSQVPLLSKLKTQNSCFRT
jgi:hypothetical protein